MLARYKTIDIADSMGHIMPIWNDRVQVFLGAGIAVVGCVLQMAQIYLIGAVLTVGGFALYLPASRRLKQSALASLPPPRRLPRGTHMWFCIIVGAPFAAAMLLLSALSDLPPGQTAVAFFLVVCFFSLATHVGLKILSAWVRRQQ